MNEFNRISLIIFTIMGLIGGFFISIALIIWGIETGANAFKRWWKRK